MELFSQKWNFKFSILKFQISKICESQFLVKTKCSNARSQTHGNTRSEVFLVCSNVFLEWVSPSKTYLKTLQNMSYLSSPILQCVIRCYRLISSAIPCYRLIHYPRQSGWGVIDTLMSMKRLAWPSSQHEMTMERSCLQTRQTNLASRAQCCITDGDTVQGWVSRVWLMIWNFDVKFWNLKLCNFQNLNKNSQKTRERVTKLKKCGKMELFQKFARFFRIKWNFR